MSSTMASEARVPVVEAKRGPLTLLIFNAIFWPYLLSTIVVLFVPAFLIWLVTFPFDKKRRLLHRFSCYWGAHYLAWAPLAGLKVKGRERVLTGGPYVFVSNHQSMVDILAVFGTHLDFLWVSKKENFYVPFLGWNMALCKYVALKRGHLPSIMRMYRTCLRRIAEGHSLFIFPEGTRSPDGELKDFYKGAFRIAARNKLQVVPIVMDGTATVLPKSSFKITPTPVSIHILDPIDPADHGFDHRRLSKAVHDVMSTELDVMRGRA